MKPVSTTGTIFLLLFLLICSSTIFSQTTIFSATGNSWKYLNDGSNPGSTWKDPSFNDAAWGSGNTEFAYPSGTTSLGSNPMTTYFRKQFTITGLSTFSDLSINYYRNDGVIIYVNGVEVGRDNMPAGAVSNSTSATARLNNGQTSTQQTITGLSTSLFNEGSNWIAVEVHQYNSTQGLADMRFQLGLTATPLPTISIDRGPYIMVVGETEATIRWRTNIASDSRVQLGTAVGSYTMTADDVTSTTQHVVKITGLSPDTKYYYRVGTIASPTLGGGASDYYFRTAAPQNVSRRLKFAVFGDCGRNDNSFRTQSISAYQSYVGSNTADALLLLGDNAYTNGTESEYNTGFFAPMSSTMLKNHPLFPAPGNHDYYGTSQSSRSGEYYQAFSMPTNAECGGVASGSKSYYSWNWGDVHFLSLDSYGTETASNLRLYDTTGPQVTWIKNDLAANTRKWVVAYWHHPPYTMGSHTSNTETELVNIRYNFIRILERLGVDLILCGHSHDYERSKLLNGHYGTEVATGAMTPYLVSNSSGMYDDASSCPYTTTSNTPNHGTVYVVAGSSGADGGVLAGLDGYPHNALPYSIDDGGMFYFEVEGNRLDAKFLRRNNTVGDKFTIIKDVNQTTNLTVANGNAQTLTASWPGSYSWNTSATTQSITVTPPSNLTTNYTVTDQFGCFTNQFSITTLGTLPVLLKGYTVALRQQKVYVNWTTVSEINNRHFTIERSADNRLFQPVGIVNGAGNSDRELPYEFIDPSPLEGVSYYRLSQTDINGSIKYYDVRKIVNNKNSRFYADVYQSGSNEVMVQVYTNAASKVQVRVLDFNGRVVKNDTWQANTGSNTRTIQLRSGSYIIECRNGKNETASQKIIVH